MTDWREELVEKMANAMFASDEDGTLRVDAMARAALAVAEPVIREQADNALREENAGLREALKPFAEAFESDYAEQEEDHWDLWESAAASILTYGHLRAAKAAILGKVKAEAACPEPDEAP